MNSQIVQLKALCVNLNRSDVRTLCVKILRHFYSLCGYFVDIGLVSPMWMYEFVSLNLFDIILTIKTTYDLLF